MDRSSQIECVMFDIGKTLISFDLLIFAKKMSGYTEKSEEEIVKATFKSDLYFSLEKGKISPDEYIGRVIEETEAKDITKEEVIKGFISIFFPNHGVEKILEKAQRDKKIMLLSNISEIHWENYFKDHPIIKEFFSQPWQQVLSFRVGHRKPEKEIFLEALEMSGVEPQNTLFIDDKEKNVEGFRSVGGNAECYNCIEDPIEKLRSFVC